MEPFTYTPNQTAVILGEVEQLMRTANIPVRDTWKGWSGENFDDASYNNGHSGGPRLFNVVFLPRSFSPQIHFELMYSVPGHLSFAYDKFNILIPDYYQERRDIIAHECVHFLQHNTLELQQQYIVNIDGDYNYAQYVEQRCELEAHFVQLLYLSLSGIEINDPVIRFVFLAGIQECLVKPEKRRGLILYAKEMGII
jgi:hypothetical protein